MTKETKDNIIVFICVSPFVVLMAWGMWEWMMFVNRMFPSVLNGGLK
jgi:hypothetical protein